MLYTPFLSKHIFETQRRGHSQLRRLLSESSAAFLVAIRVVAAYTPNYEHIEQLTISGYQTSLPYLDIVSLFAL